MTTKRGDECSRSIARKALEDQTETALLRELGIRLKHLRGKRTLMDLAAEAGMAASTISYLERGLSDPTLGSLLRLQKALGLRSIEEMLGPHVETPSAEWGRRVFGDERAVEAS